jgi:predicted nucleic acid-binding Zn ribbon protein
VKKLLSSPAIQFKGSGWYITDYAKKPSSDSSAAAKPSTETSTTAASTDSQASESAPAKPADKKD